MRLAYFVLVMSLDSHEAQANGSQYVLTPMPDTWLRQAEHQSLWLAYGWWPDLRQKALLWPLKARRQKKRGLLSQALAGKGKKAELSRSTASKLTTFCLARSGGRVAVSIWTFHFHPCWTISFLRPLRRSHSSGIWVRWHGVTDG
jgi:hypothetical protein